MAYRSEKKIKDLSDRVKEKKRGTGLRKGGLEQGMDVSEERREGSRDREVGWWWW